MVGAPFLAGMGSLRTGAGLVTIASTLDVVDKLEKRVVEIMTLRISDDCADATKTLLEFIEQRRVSALVLGSGMNPASAEIVNELIPFISIPAVLDAGAVTCYADNLSLLDKVSQNNPQLVLTPHDGEFKKLTGFELPADTDDRKKIAENFATIHRLTLVCKGFPTLVAHADGTIYENHTGNPGLATAGTGDVLTGVIAGLFAQGYSATDAADTGVYLHGLAADIAVRDTTQPGLIASDVAEYIPQALHECV